MKKECDIRVLRANLEAEMKNRTRDFLEMGVDGLAAGVTIAVYKAKLEVLDEILETNENICYG